MLNGPVDGMVSVQHDFPSVYAHFVAFFILSQSAATFKIGIKSLYWEGMAVSQKEYIQSLLFRGKALALPLTTG